MRLKPYGVRLWKNIKRKQDSVSSLIRYNVGDGTKIHFWHELWNSKTTLKEQYPDILQITRERDAKVVDYLEY